MEQRFGVGIKSYGTSQCGCLVFFRNKTEGRNLHPWIGWIQGRCDADAEPAPWRRYAILLGLPFLRSQGDTPVWRERHRMTAGDGEEALVHR